MLAAGFSRFFQDWGNLICTIVLVAVTTIYVALTKKLVDEAAATRRDAARQSKARAARAARTMATELGALREYIKSLEFGTKPPYPKLTLATLDHFLREADHLPDAAVREVLKVQYQLLACGERSDNDGWNRRVGYLKQMITSAEHQLASEQTVEVAADPGSGLG
jgi:hypothetical protein